MPKIHVTFEFADEAEMRAHFGAPTETPAPVQVDPISAPETALAVTTDTLDADGMPYDAAVHADPPSFTADNRWRAKRGKAEEAKAAREAFLARGANVEPPADLPPMPLAASTAVPGLPGMPGMDALPPSAPEPVTVERLYEVISETMKASPTFDVRGFYAEFTGQTDQTAIMQIINTNETVRAQMMRHLESL